MPKNKIRLRRLSPNENDKSLLSLELIAAKELLRRWVRKYAPGNRPGAWDYDHDAVELIETTANLLGVKDPWEKI